MLMPVIVEVRYVIEPMVARPVIGGVAQDLLLARLFLQRFDADREIVCSSFRIDHKPRRVELLLP